MNLVTLNGCDHEALPLRQYFALRAGIFRDTYGSTQYAPEPRDVDKEKDTIFLLACDGDLTVAGLCITVHPRHSDRRLGFERHPSIKIENLFPHLDTHNLSYAEIGGAATLPSHRLSHLCTVLISNSLLGVRNANPDVDVVIANIQPLSIGSFYRAALESDLNNMVRSDLQFEDGKERFVAMLSRHKGFSFISDEMRARGIGKTFSNISREEIQTYRNKRNCPSPV